MWARSASSARSPSTRSRTQSGEVWKGRLWKPDRHRFRRWLETRSRSSRQRRPSQDRGRGLHRLALCGRGDRSGRVRSARGGAGRHSGDAGPQEARQDRPHRRSVCSRDLLHAGELPESWIPPEPVLEWRERTRLYKSLVDQRAVWVQRIHAELYPARRGRCPTSTSVRRHTPGLLSSGDVSLSDAARQRIGVGYAMIDAAHSEAEASAGPGHPVRSPAAGMPGADRRDLRVRANRCGGGVVRARRLPTLHPVPPGRAPHRPRRHRRRVGLRRRAAATCPGRVRPRCGGRCSKPACARRGRPARTGTTTDR